MTPRDDLRALTTLGSTAFDWRDVALRVGEELASVGPDGYYNMTPTQWMEWALRAIAAVPQEPATGSAGISACGCWFDNHQRYTCATHRFVAHETPAPRTAEDIEQEYRRHLWLNHGCTHALYGDDGEMQCNDAKRHGFLDFKRDTLERLESKLDEMKLRLISDARTPAPPATTHPTICSDNDCEGDCIICADLGAPTR